MKLTQEIALNTPSPWWHTVWSCCITSNIQQELQWSGLHQDIFTCQNDFVDVQIEIQLRIWALQSTFVHLAPPDVQIWWSQNLKGCSCDCSERCLCKIMAQAGSICTVPHYFWEFFIFRKFWKPHVMFLSLYNNVLPVWYNPSKLQ